MNRCEDTDAAWTVITQDPFGLAQCPRCAGLGYHRRPEITACPDCGGYKGLALPTRTDRCARPFARVLVAPESCPQRGQRSWLDDGAFCTPVRERCRA